VSFADYVEENVVRRLLSRRSPGAAADAAAHLRRADAGGVADEAVRSRGRRGKTKFDVSLLFDPKAGGGMMNGKNLEQMRELEALVFQVGGPRQFSLLISLAFFIFCSAFRFFFSRFL
jgi:hypothetical protein